MPTELYELSGKIKYLQKNSGKRAVKNRKWKRINWTDHILCRDPIDIMEYGDGISWNRIFKGTIKEVDLEVHFVISKGRHIRRYTVYEPNFITVRLLNVYFMTMTMQHTHNFMMI